MKKLFLSIFFTVLFLHVWAQNDQKYQPNRSLTDTLPAPSCHVDSLWIELANKHTSPKKAVSRIEKIEEGGYSIVTTFEYSFSSATDSIPKGKGVDVYDKAGNLILRIFYEWSFITKTWIENTKDEWQFDESGNYSKGITYEWDPDSKIWILISKLEAEYDFNGNPIYTSNYHYNKYENSWNELKIESNYDASGNFLSAKWYYRDNTLDDWQFGKVIGCSNDEFGNLILRESYYIDPDSNWIGLEKIEWSYDTTGNLIEKIEHEWDAVASDWVPKTKNEISYDGFGKETIVVYRWISEINNWAFEK